MTRDLCDEIKSISTSFLKKHQYFQQGEHSGIITWSGGVGESSSISVNSTVHDGIGWIRLRYTQTDWDGKKESLDYRVALTITKCRLGGRRFWFVCPLTKAEKPCQRRVGKLYISGKYFGCRTCYELGYRTQYRKYSGKLARSFKVVGMADDIAEKEEKMRVKFWKGRPTKRYAKLLRQRRTLHRLARDPRLFGSDD